MNGPLKWHGGKHYLAKKIVALMPPHRHYVEPFAGGLAVLLEKDPEGHSEVVNDLNRELTNFWRVLQIPPLFEIFRRVVEAVPLSRIEFDKAGAVPEYSMEYKAAAFFIRCRQSRAGGFKGFTSITRSRTRRGMNGNASEWLGAVEGLRAVHARLIAVVIENIPALDLIRREDTPETLFYCDPPYLHETRVSTAAYAYEMSDADHEALLYQLLSCRGRVMLSGYRSELYDRVLSGWSRHDFDLPNNAAGGETKRRMVESLWCNWRV